METKPAQFTAETENLLIALYSRAHDAKSAKPILNDRMAVTVSESIEYDYAKLKIRDDDAISLAIRGELIDGWIRSFLDAHPDAVVLHLGTGLDGRVHRMDPPASVEWYDLDLPEIAALYAQLFPEREHHHVIGSSVMDLKWLEQVPTDRPTVIVAEGLLVYFTEEEVKGLIRKLFSVFPSGQLIFDAYTPFSVKAMNKHWTVKASGKRFVWGLAEPASLEQWHPGVKHHDAWTFFGSPYIAHMPWTSRVVCKIMNAIPALRHYNRVMRYSF